MTKRKVIHSRNFRLKFPLSTALAIWIVLDKLNAPPILYGFFGAIFFIFGLLCIYDRINTDKIDLLNE